jgi:hypothetical protein
VSSAASAAITGIDWMPDDPVPITPTRWPARSTPSWGHRPVWNVRPRNDSPPSMAGVMAEERQPVAITRNWAS